MLKKILIAGAVVVIAIVAVGLARGSDWKVERSLAMKAQPATVLPLLTDFEKGWTQWSIWSSMDKQAKWTFAGTPGTVGHAMTWGGPEVGSGTLTIKSITPTQVELEGAIESKDKNDLTTFTLKSEGETTTVTWLDEGHAPPVIGGLFKGKLEQMLGEQFQKNLEQLKAVAEKKQLEQSAPPVGDAPPVPQTPPTETPPTAPPTETPPADLPKPPVTVG